MMYLARGLLMVPTCLTSTGQLEVLGSCPGTAREDNTW